jgi:apolipoprotein N-acyltransferase
VPASTPSRTTSRSSPSRSARGGGGATRGPGRWESRGGLGLACLAGAALGASFVDFRLFVLPWVALAPLIALAERAGPRRAFALGYAAGLAGIVLAFAWLVYAFRVFGGFSMPVALGIFVAPVAWMALQLGGATALVAWLGPLPFGLTAPLAFTAVEFLFPSLFPWRLAHSQYRAPLLLQSGDLAGPSLLTFAMVWASAGLLAAWRRLRGGPGRAALGTVLAPALLLAALAGYGAWRLAVVGAARAEAPALRVGVIQGNVGIERKGDRSFFRRNLEDYRALSRGVAPEVDLLVWPETVVVRPIPVERTVLTGAASPFPDLPRPLIFGGLAAGVAGGAPRLFNSAFLLREDGTVAGRYDKRILVPFGEYMPLGDRFPFLRELSPATSDFGAGTDAVLLDVTAAARVGPLICYEDVVPGPARDAVRLGATLLLNLTNDAWYGDGPEPVQHQALAVWRAVELRRDLVRATNTGLTSAVAATGEVLGELPTFEAAALVAEVRLLAGATVYGRYGDVFAWAIVATLVLGAARRHSRSGRRVR